MHGTDMMGSDDPVGEQRFLSWHRDYVLVLEKELKKVASSLSVPYWDWTTDRTIPAWLKSFKPSVPMPNGSTINVIRYLSKGGAKLPTKKAVNRVLTHSSDYTSFTDGLESLHNNVHVWVGGVHQISTSQAEVGTMGNKMISPADPMFWLHHAQIDRIWSIWQQTNSGKPALTGAKAKMDPWPETASQLGKTDALGGAVASLSYTYA